MNVSQSEETLSRQLSRYLRLQYPNVRFHFDFGSGLKLDKAAAMRQKLLNEKAWPDLFIAEPRFMPGTVTLYYGLFIELKREGTRIFKRDGSYASDHIAEQAEVLDHLAHLGYVAQFACGFDEAQTLIDSYLKTGLKDVPAVFASDEETF